MKKVLLTLLALAVVVGGISVTRAAEETTRPPKDQRPLEKILHPSHIKNFEAIEKIGTALWGKKRGSGDSVNRASETSEKRSMKPSDTKETKKTETKQSIKVEPVAAACVKTAIEKKDTNLKTALTAHNTSIMTAIDARTTCQQSALDLTTVSAQFKANATCVRAYHQGVGESLKVLKTAKETGWKTFREELKACKTLQPTPTTQGEIIVEDGEMQINLEVEKASDPAATDVKNVK